MKRTYSGYCGNNQKENKTPRITRMQIMPLALVFGIFIVYLLLSGKSPWAGVETPGSDEGVASFFYVKEHGGGFYEEPVYVNFPPFISAVTMLETGFKEPPEGYLKTIEFDVYINKVSINNTCAGIDFSIYPVAADNDAEKNAKINAITRTIRNLYYTHQVDITVDGEIVHSVIFEELLPPR